MHDLKLTKFNGDYYMDSRDVAEAIGKRHDHFLRDIARYRKTLAKANLPKLGVINFFVESTYTDTRGRVMPCYLLSKAGCEICANKLIGKKGMLFTAAYVTKFNEMETAERDREITAHKKPRLGEFNSAVRNVLSGMSKCFAVPKKVMSFLGGVYKPLGIDVLTVSEADQYCNYYTVTEIAEELHVYSDTGKPHGHAVSAIISKLDNVAGHAIAIPYGLVGVSMRYDRHILEAVSGWLVEHNFPSTVPHLGFEYHIYYFCQLSLLDDIEYGFD